MAERYDPPQEDGRLPEELDEFLCEYVDGSMDPSVRCAFEEYLSANPEVACQVDGIRRAALLLRKNGCRRCAPRGFQDRLKVRVAQESLYRRLPFGLNRLYEIGAYVAGGSAVTILCVAAFVLAAQPSESNRASFASQSQLASSYPAAAVEWTNRKVIPRRQRTAPRRSLAISAVALTPQDYDGAATELELLLSRIGPEPAYISAP